MQNPVLKIVNSLVFMFGVIGACLLFLGRETVLDANRIDSEWEQVTLQQFIDGKTQNEVLFEISEFRAGDQYLTLRDGTDPFSMVYVPLYTAAQEEDEGAAIKLVLGIGNATSEMEFNAIVDGPSIQIKSYGDSAPEYARQLSMCYPQIDWTRVKWAVVNDHIPTASAGWWMVAIGSGLILLSLCCLVCSVSIWYRTFHAKRIGFADTASEVKPSTQSDSKSELGESAASDAIGVFGKYADYIAGPLILFNLVIAVGTRRGFIDEQFFNVLYVTVPLFLLSGLFSVLSRFFVAPKFRIESCEASEIPASVLNRMYDPIEQYQLHGFRFLGFAVTNFISRKFNAFMLSADERQLVEISDEKGKLSTIVISVTSDGLVYCSGKATVDIDIDGTKLGVPIVAILRKKCSVVESIAALNEFSRKVKHSDSHLLRILPNSVFHLMHYEVILSGWWAYKSSLRFSKPEPMPPLDEVGGCENTFAFRRDETLDSSFGESSTVPDVITETLGDTTPATTASFGGEELYSTRFLKNTELS